MLSSFIKKTALATFVALSIFSCKKLEYDAPPLNSIPVGNVMTVQQLRASYTGQRIKFTEDKSIYAVVTMDEETGNIYRNVFIQDHTAAINMRLLSPGGLYQGDSIRVNLNGAVLNVFNGMMQLDSVSVDFNVVKQATLVNKAPQNVSITEVNTSLQGQLVKINDVEFVQGNLGQTWANAITQQTQNRTLTDCDGNTIIVRTSGFANFAGQAIPTGKGSIVGVVSQFNNDIQIFVRSMPEVDMEGPRCGSGPCDYNTPAVNELSDDFTTTAANQDYNNINFVNVAAQGTRVWRGAAFGGNNYVRASSFNSTDATNEAWLISRPITFSGNKFLRFKSAKNSGTDVFHDALSVWVSTNFDGCNPTEATWTEVTGYTKPTSASANFAFVESGDINLSQYVSGGAFHIGFKYLSSFPSQTTSFDLDDIFITNEAGGSGGGGGGNQNLILTENFESLPAGSGANELAVNLSGWINLNVSTNGTRLWHVRSFAGNKYSEFSSFFSDEGTSDEVWLVTPAMDFSAFTDKYLSFGTKARFWAAGTDLQVLISENYDGTEDGLNSANWTALNPTLPTAQTDNFVSSGTIDISNFEGSNVRIAFKYVGSKASGTTTTFQIDDIEVTGE